MTAAEAKNYAKERLKEFGWDESEFGSLEILWEKESNWNYKAKNPKSGTLGIPQLKGADKVTNFMNDYKIQIEHGLAYIKNKYGSPKKALEAHKKKGWY